MGQELRRHPVELVEGRGGIEDMAVLGRRHGAEGHLLGIAVGQALKLRGVAGDAAHGNELRGHGPRADRRGADAPVPELIAEAPGKAGDIGLGGAVGVELGVGAEGGDGAGIQDMGARLHIGQHQVGDGGEGPDVEIDHRRLALQGPVPHVAEIPAAGVIEEQDHLRLLRRQLLPQSGEALLPAEIQGQHHGLEIRQLRRQGLQPVLPPGDEPELLHLREDPLELPGELDAQPRGRPRQDGGLHRSAPFSGAG